MDRLGTKAVQNRLLLARSPPDYDAVVWCLEPVQLPPRLAMVETEHEITGLHVIESAIASVVVANADGEKAEVGNIGFEGATGTAPLRA